jgi:tetrahydromethanopterin S-methyltransferase subunit E
VTTASVISIVIGLIIVAILAIANRKVEVFARNKYGPYTK